MLKFYFMRIKVNFKVKNRLFMTIPPKVDYLDPFVNFCQCPILCILSHISILMLQISLCPHFMRGGRVETKLPFSKSWNHFTMETDSLTTLSKAEHGTVAICTFIKCPQQNHSHSSYQLKYPKLSLLANLRFSISHASQKPKSTENLTMSSWKVDTSLRELSPATK